MSVSLDTIVSLCKRRGFIFQGSEIYGGMAATYDYGPLGIELKRNVKEAWWREMIHRRHDVEGLDAAILMHPNVWRASGHVSSFTDPLVDCKSCRKRFRADHLDGYRAIYEVNGSFEKEGKTLTTLEVEMGDVVPDNGVFIKHLAAEGYLSVQVNSYTFKASPNNCPDCGNAALTAPRQFNLMFETHTGPVKDDSSLAWLRPETAQGIFVNFENVRSSMNRKLPFGIGQIGKSFRNEITTKAFVFRTLEFEQMEMEFFIKPGTDAAWHEYWMNERLNFYAQYGIDPEHLRLRAHADDELAHYSKGCSDVEYLYPWGWGELEGIANRGEYDLKQHMEHAGRDLTYFDHKTNERYLPQVIEPAAGVDRSTIAFMMDAYREEEVKGKKRVVLQFHHSLAPIKVAVLPLLKNRPEIREMCHRITADLRSRWVTRYNDTASIGRLYRRQDEVGTPFCVTVDVESLDDNAVTIRNRDTMEQQRITADRLVDFMQDNLNVQPEPLPNPAPMPEE